MKEHLIVLDMQEGFLRDKPPELVANATLTISKLIYKSRQLARPITFVLFLGYGHGPIIPTLWDLANPDEVVTKKHDNAFTSPDFVNRVGGSNLLYLTGCNLEFCVIATIKDAIVRGMDVIAYKNAILSCDTSSSLKDSTELWLATAARCLFQEFNE